MCSTDEAAFGGFRPGGKFGGEAIVHFDGDQLRCAGIEQGAGQPAGAGADFEHGAPLDRATGERDPAQQVAVEQEVLAERLLGGAERRVAAHVAEARACAIWSASFSAAIRLSGFAVPLAAAS